MIQNMHPADELAMVRSDIERLKSREAFLRRGFLSDTLARDTDIAAGEATVLSKPYLNDKWPSTNTRKRELERS